MTPAGMTKRQFDLMLFVQGYIAEHGYSPSCREIAAGIGLRAPSNVHYMIRSLSDRGLCRHVPGHSRSIVLTENGRAAAQKFGAAA